jgi:hypothetical protein
MRFSLVPLFIFSALVLVSCDSASITQPGNGDNGNGTSTSARIIGGSDIDISRTILQTSDGGYLIIGTSSSNDGNFAGLNNGNRDIYALKLNSFGNILWLRTYGGSNSDWAIDAIEDSAGNFIITGNSRSNDGIFPGLNRGENDIFLVKIAPNGDLIWARTYGGSDEDYGYAVTEGPAGGYIITGATRSTDLTFSNRTNSSIDIFIMLTDLNGQPAWVQTFGGTENDAGLDVAVSQNNGIVVTGSFNSANGDFSGAQPGGTSFFIIETQLNGNLIGITTYGGGGSDFGNQIIRTADGGYAIAGRSDSNNGHFADLNRGGYDAFVMKLNQNRNILWVNTFGGSGDDEAHSLLQTPGGEYLIAGETGSNNGNFEGLNRGELDAFTIRINANGSFNRAITYGGSDSESAQSITRLPNGNLAITGWTESNDGDFDGPPIDTQDIFFIRTDPSGVIQ